MDGALMENGIYVEFYSNDNLLGEPFERTIFQSTQSAYTPSTFDRYSYRATCYVRPPYSEEYSLVNQVGMTVFINDRLVMKDGQTVSSAHLSNQVWSKLEIINKASGTLYFSAFFQS